MQAARTANLPDMRGKKSPPRLEVYRKRRLLRRALPVLLLVAARTEIGEKIRQVGALQILSILIGIVTGGSMFFGGFGGWGWGPEFGFRAMLAMLGGLVNLLIGLLGFILWILLILKAYQRQPFRVPIAAGIADSLAGKSA